MIFPVFLGQDKITLLAQFRGTVRVDGVPARIEKLSVRIPDFLFWNGSIIFPQRFTRNRAFRDSWHPFAKGRDEIRGRY